MKYATCKYEVVRKFDGTSVLKGSYKFLIGIADPDLQEPQLRGEEKLCKKTLQSRWNKAAYEFYAKASF